MWFLRHMEPKVKGATVANNCADEYEREKMLWGPVDGAYQRSDIQLLFKAIKPLYSDNWSKKDVLAVAKWIRKIATRKGSK